MSDYMKTLENIGDKIVELLLTAENHEMYLLALIDKAKKAGICKSKATLRDAIMAAACKKKLKVEERPPNQLMVLLPDRR
jgi:hypothetical protein